MIRVHKVGVIIAQKYAPRAPSPQGGYGSRGSNKGRGGYGDRNSDGYDGDRGSYGGSGTNKRGGGGQCSQPYWNAPKNDHYNYQQYTNVGSKPSAFISFGYTSQQDQ